MKGRAGAREIQANDAGGAEGGRLVLRALLWQDAAAHGPALLLLHATSFCGAVWAPVLGATGVRVPLAVAPDARGHGVSGAPRDPGGFAWPRLVEDVLAWIDAVAPAGGAGLLLVGHSSGATAALAAAARRPGRVRGVLAVEPVLFDPLPPGADTDSYPGSRFMAERARKRRSRFASRAEARERLAARPPFASFAADSLDAFLEHGLGTPADGGVALRCAPEHEAACYAGAGALDLWHGLPGLAAPVRLVLGERGFVAPPLLARLREALPGTRSETVAGGTHFVALEKPREVGAALGRFLRELAPETAYAATPEHVA